jgi:hypothetical protein
VYVAVAMIIGFAALYISTLFLPDTPKGWFTWYTDLKLPPHAQLVENKRDYTQGMSESFATEGSGCFAFKVHKATLDKWINQAPPWQDTWAHGVLTHANWCSSRSKPGYPVYYATTGDNSSGRMLVIDPKRGTASLHKWSW